ncbi:MAG: IS5 family transposase [Gammaproteobacteria bacterium]|nr:IS5 family transposase [Gammaproteobacteria bacterium]
MRAKQQTLATAGFERYRKPTRRERFLAEMNQVLPWSALLALIEPAYPKGEGAGRPPVGLERMLRIHFLQHWFNLSDPAVEEALYDSRAMREFVGIDLGREPAPDETTILKFRHLLEREELGAQILACMNAHLAERGFKVTTGTIVDATIIAAPPSTKNRDGQRDPEMHQTKKGNAWHFGMKAHVGVDSATKIIHSVAATPANVHDSHLLPELLHGDETRVWGDSAYQGQSEIIKAVAPKAKDFTHRRYRRMGVVDRIEQRKNRNKSRVRARGEHPFLILKCVFGFAKVRYRGIAKNAQRLFVACALVNVYLLRRPLLHAT